MGCGTTCLKALIIGINIVFGLIGLVLFAGGLFARFGLSDQLNDTLGDILSGLPAIPDLIGFVDSAADSASSELSIDFGDLLRPVATALIVIGVIILIISVCGVCGACCNSRCLMIMYCVLVGVLLTAQIILVALFFTNTLDDQIDKHINNTIVNDFVGIDDYGLYSLTWNAIMTYFECCGLYGYEDFQYAKNWNKQRVVDVSGVNVTVTLATPAACCKFNGTWPSVVIVDNQCSIAPLANNSNYNVGCRGEVSNRLDESSDLAIGIISAILVIQGAIMVAGIIIAHSQRESKDGVV